MESFTKARLCTKGFEGTEKFETNSRTRSEERITISVMKTFKCDLNFINIKTAFVQGKKTTRNMVINPPKEVNSKL